MKKKWMEIAKFHKKKETGRKRNKGWNNEKNIMEDNWTFRLNRKKNEQDEIK